MAFERTLWQLARMAENAPSESKLVSQVGHAHGKGPSRPRRANLWLLGVGLAVLALHAPYLVPGGPTGQALVPVELIRDEGTVLYDSLRAARGEWIYRDFFQFHGPVFYCLFGALFRALGASIEAARAAQLIVWSLTAVLLAQLVARYAGRVAGVAAAAIHAAILVPMWPLAYPHWLAELFALLGLATLARRSEPRHDLAGGALLGASLLTIQSLGVPVLVACTAGAAWRGLIHRDWRAAVGRPVRIAAGTTVLLGAVAAAFAAGGALRAMVDDMFSVTFSQYPHFQAEAGAYASNLRPLLEVHAALPKPWSWFGEVSLAATAALPVVAAGTGLVALGVAAWRVALPRAGARFDPATVLLAAGSLAAVSPLWLARTRHDLTHLAFLASFGLVALALLAHFLGTPAAARVAGILLALVGACGVASYTGKFAATWRGSRAMGSFREQVAAFGGRYQALPGVYATIAASVPGNESIIFGELGGFHYFYLRHAATSFTLLPVGLSDDFMTDAMWRKAADEICSRRPAVILLMPYQHDRLREIRADVFAGYDPEPGYSAYGRFLRRRSPAAPR